MVAVIVDGALHINVLLLLIQYVLCVCRGSVLFLLKLQEHFRIET